MTTGPGNSGTLPQAISAASLSASLICCGTPSAGVHVRCQVLVRELARTDESPRHRRCGRDEVNHSASLRALVAQQRVQVHAQRLRTHLAGDRLPRPTDRGRIGQQVPAEMRSVQDGQPASASVWAGAERDQSAGLLPANRRRRPGPTFRSACPSASRTAPGERCRPASAEPGEEHRARLGSLPMEAANRRPTLARFSQALKRPLQGVRQTLAAKLARQNHLEQRPQHPAIVDDAVEDLRKNQGSASTGTSNNAAGMSFMKARSRL